MMKKGDISIVFMGTPEFAVPTLEAIFKEGYHVAAVVTAPDRPAGRGRKLKFSAVKQFALEHGIKLLQPTNLKDPGFIEELKGLNPDLQIVVAFRMLPKQVWSIPNAGTFNLHASLLPQYRGAAPINHAIINGEKQSGLTTFFIDEKIDTGKVLEQVTLKIGDEETFGELHDRMMLAGADLVLKTIEKITNTEVEVIDQQSLIEEGDTLKNAPKLSKEFCEINWDEKLTDVFNFIRGLSPYPAAFSYLDNQEGDPITVKFFSVKMIEKNHEAKSGSIVTDDKSYLHIAVQGGYIDVCELQLMGKRRMTIKELLNGFKVSNRANFIN